MLVTTSGDTRVCGEKCQITGTRGYPRFGGPCRGPWAASPCARSVRVRDDEPVAYWLIQANPKKWRIFDFRRDGKTLDTWNVKRHLDQLAAGDKLVLWLSGPSGGVVGLGHIIGPAYEVSEAEADDGYWAPGEITGPQHQVPIRMDEYFFDAPVGRELLKADPDFANALILRAPQSANPMRLSATELDAIQRHLDRESEPSDWDLLPGQTVRRVDLHRQFGGNGQSGISPCADSPHVLVFTDSRSGDQLGYVDQWATDDTFLYAGEGQTGDQAMTGGNKAILNHVADGRAIRLFDGARGTVRYVGEFQIDPDEPWRFIRARQRDSEDLRNVIQFRLQRMAEPSAPVDQLALTTGTEYRPQDEHGAIAPPTAQPPRDPDAGGRGLRMHRTLQNGLASAVSAAGLTPVSPAPHDPDFDLLWFTARDAVTVVEVKSLTRANEIRQLRMGIGQVLDYADTLSRRHTSVSAVLYIPRSPTDSRWITLAATHGIAICWPGHHEALRLPANEEGKQRVP